MLTVTILIITAIILVLLWYAQTDEQRRENRERARIAIRIEKQKLEALKIGEDVDATILWGDVTSILDSLQIASRHAEGVQGIKDLAVLIENQNLIIKKQGQLIRVKDISQLQSLVDTYESQIKCLDYINDSAISLAHQKDELQSTGVSSDTKKDAYLGFAKIVSANNDKVFDEISLYFDSPEKYFDKFYFDLTQRGIDKLSALSDVIILVDALSRQNKVVYHDWKTELYHSLEMLDQIVDGALLENSRFTDLVKQAKISLIGVSIMEEPQGDSIFETISDSGYKLLSLDENSDSYAFFMIPLDKLKDIVGLSQSAGIKLHFVEKP